MSKRIKLIIGSTRQGRAGQPVSEWLLEQAKSAGYEVEVLDLQRINLPFFDAPIPPAYAPTQTVEGKAWAQQIAEADGFIFVTPEYNRSIPASLKNALDFLVAEWKDKPAAIVSYGYIDGGASATRHLQDVLDWLKVRNVGEKMSIQFTQETFDENGAFKDVASSLGNIREPFIAALKAIAQ